MFTSKGVRRKAQTPIASMRASALHLGAPTRHTLWQLMHPACHLFYLLRCCWQGHTVSVRFVLGRVGRVVCTLTTIIPACTSFTPQNNARTSPCLNALLASHPLFTAAAVAMSAARNFHQTTYKDSSKWWMVLLWPVLAILSPSYREQLDTVLRGTMDSSEDESN